MKMSDSVVTVSSSKYINMQNEINQLRIKNKQLQAIVDSVAVALKNGGIVK